MKREFNKYYIITSILLSVLLFKKANASSIQPQEATPKSITIGLIPGGNPEAIRSQSVILAEKIQKYLNLPVHIFISKNYAGLVEAVKNKKVDYAFLSALTYVQAEREVELKVLLKKTWSGPYYYSALVTLKNSSIKNAAHFKNKKIAFVDTASASGYLYPQVYLQKNKITDESFKKVVISGSHAASVEKLEDGEVDLIAVFADDEIGKKGAWTRFSKNKKVEFKTIWVSEPIPNDPIVVRTDFYNQYPKFTHQLMSDLIDIQSEELQKKTISEIMGQGELMPATAKQYDPVREMNKTLKVKQ
jgi:phosphonate transport system substrate-binding protein